jgi:hypothetical protein
MPPNRACGETCEWTVEPGARGVKTLVLPKPAGESPFADSGFGDSGARVASKQLVGRIQTGAEGFAIHRQPLQHNL